MPVDVILERTDHKNTYEFKLNTFKKCHVSNLKTIAILTGKVKISFLQVKEIKNITFQSFKKGKLINA